MATVETGRRIKARRLVQDQRPLVINVMLQNKRPVVVVKYGAKAIATPNPQTFHS
jgi:hypothetical protein